MGKLLLHPGAQAGRWYHLPARASTADWADMRQKNIFFSRDGKLFRMRAPPIECDDAIELADFGDMKFEPIEAPVRAAKC